MNSRCQFPRTSRHRIIFYHFILFVHEINHISLHPQTARLKQKLTGKGQCLLHISVNLIPVFPERRNRCRYAPAYKATGPYSSWHPGRSGRLPFAMYNFLKNMP